MKTAALGTLLSVALAACGGATASSGSSHGSSSALPLPPTPSAPTPSEEAFTGTIVFSLEYGNEGSGGAQLMTVHPDGSGLTALTQLSLGSASDPAWSADQRSILFDLQRKRTSHIWEVANLAGAVPVAITHGGAFDADPAPSPQGRRLAFARARFAGAPMSIYVMNLDGSGARRITTGTGSDGDSEPTYAPDGRRIAFIRNGAVETMDLDGSQLHQVVGPNAQAVHPHWSPDGRTILYGDTSDGNYSARIVAASGGRPVTVGSLGDANWSPDGSRIIGNYLDMTLPAFWLVSVKPDGTDMTYFWHPEPHKDLWPNVPAWGEQS
jgi:Tol biopolymer transport system component